MVPGFERLGQEENSLTTDYHERHYTDCPVVESTLKQAARERFMRD